MGKIKLLPKDVVSQIAAGEVIQKPADVVKELVENSLDANSTNIKISIKEYGYKSISVIDDGDGMDRQDLADCVLPHSTSKLYTTDDLMQITSMGFRGEALNSISSISKLTISSRPKNSIEGNTLEVHGGSVSKIKSVGMPLGTKIAVEELFYNVPVRKSFLRKKHTEYNQILNVITNLAIANPTVGFEFFHNEKEVFSLPINQNVLERISEILGDSFKESLIPLAHNQNHVQIKGYISRPQNSLKSQRRQYLFVNNRPVYNLEIANAIRNAYGNLLEAKAYPPFLLHLTFPLELVDVNVHPRKEVVRFSDSGHILENLDMAVKQSLSKHNLTYTKQGFMQANEFLLNELGGEIYLGQSSLNKNDTEIIQIHNLYLISQTSGGVMLVDQHAAHERILFEKFLAEYKKVKTEDPVELEESIIFDLPLAEAQIFDQNIKTFLNLGFTIEEFGKNTYKITHAPEILIDRNLVDLIENVLSDIMDGKDIKKDYDLDEKTLLALSYLSCRSAIKAGDYLAPEERKSLLQELENTSTNYTCPHGRPTKVIIPISELNGMFKRFKGN